MERLLVSVLIVEGQDFSSLPAKLLFMHESYYHSVICIVNSMPVVRVPDEFLASEIMLAVKCWYRSWCMG